MNWVFFVLALFVVGFMVYRMLPAKGVKSASPDEIKELLAKSKKTVQFVDVREAGEYASGHVTGFKNIPLSQFRNRMQEIDTDQPVVLMCRSGSRSGQAARMLAKNGYHDIRNASGGISAWHARRMK